MNKYPDYEDDFGPKIFNHWARVRAAVEMASEEQIVELIRHCIQRGVSTAHTISSAISAIGGDHLKTRVRRILEEYSTDFSPWGEWYRKPDGEHVLVLFKPAE